MTDQERKEEAAYAKLTREWLRGEWQAQHASAPTPWDIEFVKTHPQEAADQIYRLLEAVAKLTAAEKRAFDLCAALRNMADAYERKVRTGLTAEQIAKEPWRCAEYIEAERLCKTSLKLHFTNEWLREKITNDPDVSCEAGRET